jgi:hypothetical protein
MYDSVAVPRILAPGSKLRAPGLFNLICFFFVGPQSLLVGAVSMSLSARNARLDSPTPLNLDSARSPEPEARSRA